MEDDHVDRLGVQARQRVELTSTNRSIGLIALMVHVRHGSSSDEDHCLPCALNAEVLGVNPETLASVALVLRRSGGLSEAPKPDPIPNSAVKRLSANGTVSQDPGE